MSTSGIWYGACTRAMVVTTSTTWSSQRTTPARSRSTPTSPAFSLWTLSPTLSIFWRAGRSSRSRSCYRMGEWPIPIISRRGVSTMTSSCLDHLLNQVTMTTWWGWYLIFVNIRSFVYVVFSSHTIQCT